MEFSLADFDFSLPQEQIAQSPTPNPEDARLLLVRLSPTGGEPRFENAFVRDLPAILSSNPALRESLWVRNRSAVFKARIYARRPTGGRHEIVFLEPLDPAETLWKCLIRGSSHFKFPQTLKEEKTGSEIVAISANEIQLHNARSIFEIAGEMPLPPYITLRDSGRDSIRYQPIWADKNFMFSAAAPTASLHFSPELLNRLNFIEWADLFLHVGLGTFEPLRNAKLSENNLHSEKYIVPATTLKMIKNACSIVAVGTTSLRCLESLPEDLGSHESLSGSTDIFIKPGFRFKKVNHLWTNFHLPQSSLFVLVSAFAGSPVLAKEAYQFAINHRYRFFSYGDVSLWIS